MDVDPKPEEAGQQAGTAPAGPAPQPVPGQMPPPAAPQAAPAPKAEPGAPVALGAQQSDAAAQQPNGALQGPAAPAVANAQAGAQLSSHPSGAPLHYASAGLTCKSYRNRLCNHTSKLAGQQHVLDKMLSESCVACLLSGLGEMAPPPPVPQGLPKTQSGAIQLPTLLSMQSGLSNSGGGNSGIQLPSSWPQVQSALASTSA